MELHTLVSFRFVLVLLTLEMSLFGIISSHLDLLGPLTRHLWVYGAFLIAFLMSLGLHLGLFMQIHPSWGFLHLFVTVVGLFPHLGLPDRLLSPRDIFTLFNLLVVLGIIIILLLHSLLPTPGAIVMTLFDDCISLFEAIHVDRWIGVDKRTGGAIEPHPDHLRRLILLEKRLSRWGKAAKIREGNGFLTRSPSKAQAVWESLGRIKDLLEGPGACSKQRVTSYLPVDKQKNDGSDPRSDKRLALWMNQRHWAACSCKKLDATLAETLACVENLERLSPEDDYSFNLIDEEVALILMEKHGLDLGRVMKDAEAVDPALATALITEATNYPRTAVPQHSDIHSAKVVSATGVDIHKSKAEQSLPKELVMGRLAGAPTSFDTSKALFRWIRSHDPYWKFTRVSLQWEVPDFVQARAIAGSGSLKDELILKKGTLPDYQEEPHDDLSHARAYTWANLVAELSQEWHGAHDFLGELLRNVEGYVQGMPGQFVTTHILSLFMSSADQWRMLTTDFRDWLLHPRILPLNWTPIQLAYHIFRYR